MFLKPYNDFYKEWNLLVQASFTQARNSKKQMKNCTQAFLALTFSLACSQSRFLADGFTNRDFHFRHAIPICAQSSRSMFHV
jgi:hypothetical protein